MTTAAAPTSTQSARPAGLGEGPHRARRLRFDRRRARASASCSSSASSPEATSRGSSAVRSLPSAAGFALLAIASTRLTNQPQQWALVPGVVLGGRRGSAFSRSRPVHRFSTSRAGSGRCSSRPWSSSSFRGARRSLDNWSRRALLYPALVVLSLIAVGGAVGTVMAATSSNPAPASGRTYLANGHRLYLNCVGSGSPTVVLFNGLGEWTPNWAWVQANVSQATRVCAFDRAGEGWSGGNAVRAGRSPAGLRPARAPAGRACPGAVCPCRSLGRRHLRARLRREYPRQVAGVALIDSATPYQFDLPDYRSFYSMCKRASALLPWPHARSWAGSRCGAGSVLCRRARATPHARSTPRRAS